MGNPDLELQNPVRDPPCPHRRQRRDTAAGLCTAVAAGILLAIGVWSICVDATTRSLQQLQQQLQQQQNWSGHSAPRIVLAADRGAGATVVDEVEQCAIRNLNKATSFLQGIKGIEADEFLARRDTLARQLKDEGVDA
ncbi:hypothetical protein RirG_012250 [Rhizophagus irregularis DAOM 197198w]|uniref:Uncharacterized protein n=1 Tax=Rhizophagus irregularis (strain DAOM 197198w) TaxID=1432141 RepID=A0A015KGK0_RHIIW|nr:hypothetical protein RirG_012250 [Rhizophagus irregularis DAOM 197198w]